MARSTASFFKGKEINVEDALDIRNSTSISQRKNLDFKCKECGQIVRPHRAGGNAA